MMRRQSALYQQPKKFPPLVISTIIIAGGLALFFLVRTLFFGSSGTVADTELSIPPSNTVYVQLSGEESFTSFSANTVKVLESESIESRNTKNAVLTFFENSKVTLDASTALSLEKSRQHSGEAREIALSLKSGRVWADISSSLNPRSVFAINVAANKTLSSKNGAFEADVDNMVLKVTRGTVRVSQTDESGEEIGFQDVGVGQELSLNGENIEQNPLGILTSDAWLEEHSGGNAMVSGSPAVSTGTTSESSNTATGSVRSGVEILVPGKNNETITITTEPQEISGSVPTGTAKVVVNDYALSKFAEGDTTFSYIATVAYESLVEGSNEYIVKAYDKSNTLLSEAKITVIYNKDAAESTESTTSDETTSSSTQTVTGSFAITGPNGGKDFTAPDTTGVDIVGTAPSNAAKIIVDDYALSKFQPGDATWSYKVRIEFGNLKEGANTYQVKAVDAAGKTLSEGSITITFPALPAENASDSTEE